jgi:putative component of membrane protein insertase Oxa1/YidC/SpoIIIJ protein YidD
MMRLVVLAAIRFYQRHLSPRKGFQCAYRAHTGRASCSVLGYRAVRRHGVFAGLGLIRQRTGLCGVVHRRHAASLRRLHAQHGACDAGCDLPCHGGCDMPGDCRLTGDNASRVCDALRCCDCGGCDWPQRSKKRSGKERHVYIPPYSGRKR